MNTEIALYDTDTIKNKSYTIRGQQVMLDVDLAKIYGYTTKRLNEQVKTILSASMRILNFNSRMKKLQRAV